MQLAYSDGKQEVAELLCEFPRLLVNSGGLGGKKAKDNWLLKQAVSYPWLMCWILLWIMHYVRRTVQQVTFNQVFSYVFQPSRTFYIRHNLIQVTPRGQNIESDNCHFLFLCTIGCIFRVLFEIDMGNGGAAHWSILWCQPWWPQWQI